MTGAFITFEGGEGAGKSTQIARIRRRIEAAGQPVLVTREPGGSPRAERIRSFLLSGQAKAHGPLAEAVLFSVARMDHLERTIRPALAAGTHVLCDRFADSTRAYQGALGQLDGRTLDILERLAVEDTQPDLTIIFDVPVAECLMRTRRREHSEKGKDRLDAEDMEFYTRVRDAYLAIAAAEPERVRVLDASGSIEETHVEVTNMVSSFLEERGLVVDGRGPEHETSPGATGPPSTTS